MSGQKVSGNVVVVCLTVIVLAAIGSVVWLSTTGKDAPVALAALVGLLGAAVPAVINGLQVAEVKHQTNGNTTRLLNIVEAQTSGPSQRAGLTASAPTDGGSGPPPVLPR